MEWARHVVSMKDKKCKQNFSQKIEGSTLFNTFKYRNNRMGRKILGVMYWIPVTQDSKQLQALVNLALNIQFPHKAKNLTRRVNVSFSKDSAPVIAYEHHGSTFLNTADCWFSFMW